MTSKKIPMDPIDQLFRGSLDLQDRVSDIQAAAGAIKLSGARAR